jgi:hypothetical protein
LSVGDNVEAGHFAERSWLTVMGINAMKTTPEPGIAIYSVSFTMAHQSPPSPCLVAQKKSMVSIACIFFANDNHTLVQAKALGWQAYYLPAAETGSRPVLGSPALLAVLSPASIPVLARAAYTVYVKLSALFKAIERDLIDTPLAFSAEMLMTGAPDLIACKRAYLHAQLGPQDAKRLCMDVTSTNTVLRRSSQVVETMNNAWVWEMEVLASHCGLQPSRADHQLKLCLQVLGHANSSFHGYVRRLQNPSKRVAPTAGGTRGW